MNIDKLKQISALIDSNDRDSMMSIVLDEIHKIDLDRLKKLDLDALFERFVFKEKEFNQRDTNRVYFGEENGKFVFCNMYSIYILGREPKINESLVNKSKHKVIYTEGEEQIKKALTQVREYNPYNKARVVGFSKLDPSEYIIEGKNSEGIYSVKQIDYLETFVNGPLEISEKGLCLHSKDEINEGFVLGRKPYKK